MAVGILIYHSYQMYYLKYNTLLYANGNCKVKLTVFDFTKKLFSDLK